MTKAKENGFPKIFYVDAMALRERKYGSQVRLMSATTFTNILEDLLASEPQERQKTALEY